MSKLGWDVFNRFLLFGVILYCEICFKIIVIIRIIVINRIIEENLLIRYGYML